MKVVVKLTNYFCDDYDDCCDDDDDCYDLYNYTLYYKLVMAKSKCSTITFSNKRNIKAYVYNLDGNKLDLVHSIDHTPQQYTDGTLRLLDNYERYLDENNGDSDLENMDNNGKK